MRRVAVFVFIITFLIPLVGQSEKTKYNNTQFSYYWEKGNNAEALSLNEFHILMNQLDNALSRFSVSYSNIRLTDVNMSYADGKTWEIQYNSTKDDIQNAKEYLKNAKSFPNIISFSLILYVILNDIYVSGKDFCQIPIFEKQLLDEVAQLSVWTRAFQKAHLNMLAVAKDNKSKLYK